MNRPDVNESRCQRNEDEGVAESHEDDGRGVEHSPGRNRQEEAEHQEAT